MLQNIIIIMLLITSPGDFKNDQLKHSKVKEAYAEKLAFLEKLLKSKQIDISKLEIYIRAFKQEGLLEVWAKNKTDQKFQFLMSYDICRSSGNIGPKRKEGDMQVPEGYYFINHFNPESSYYLSLGINYPNSSDKIFADKNHPGGSIYIHGQCVTIGCLPITDDKIKELYVLALEARNNGQTSIPVAIFPMKMTAENMVQLKSISHSTDIWNLWMDLQMGYENFEKQKIKPIITFLNNGRHKIE